MSGQVRASHILLMYKGSMRSTADRSKDEALATVIRLKEEIAAGSDFAELAKRHSDCPSGQDGGDLGYFSQGQMVPEFDAVTFTLQPGQVSDVVETAFGYHLIQRTD